MKPEIFILGERPEHAHGDAGCFSICPVWKYDLMSKKIQFELVTARMDEIKRCGGSRNGPGRMAIYTRRLHYLDEDIKSMV